MLKRLILAAMLALCPVLASAQDEEDREGGIIGTGIVGTITHLGSIYVNGQHITFAPDLAVEDALQPLRADQLVPGQVVSVLVRPETESWQAVQIRQILALTGPVHGVTENGFTVMGTEVIHDGQPPVPGDQVAVSGLWQGDRVIASHIALLPDDHSTARITGTWLGGDYIGGTQITGIQPQHLSPGDTVTVSGRATAEGIHAERLEGGVFRNPVMIVQAEGYLSLPRPDGLYTLLGSGMVSYTDVPDMIDPMQHQVSCGTGDQLGTRFIAANDIAVRDILNRLGCDF